jgi:hypothetical protein
MTDRPIPAYRRSAFQVALLMFATWGLYVFAWAFFARRASAAILEREDQPIWKTVALVVPLFNFFLMFELGKRSRDRRGPRNARGLDGGQRCLIVAPISAADYPSRPVRRPERRGPRWRRVRAQRP